LDSWNIESANNLALIKTGLIAVEEDFLMQAEQSFSAYYQPLVPWVNRLRRKVFPNNHRWRKKNPGLYGEMIEVLRQAQEDPNVLMDE